MSSNQPVDRNTRRCPHCGSNWHERQVIPREWRKMYGRTRFSRLVSVYNLNQDRRVAWACPDCGKEFPCKH